jgi:hypothetical protein
MLPTFQNAVSNRQLEILTQASENATNSTVYVPPLSPALTDATAFSSRRKSPRRRYQRRLIAEAQMKRIIME